MSAGRIALRPCNGVPDIVEGPAEAGPSLLPDSLIARASFTHGFPHYPYPNLPMALRPVVNRCANSTVRIDHPFTSGQWLCREDSFTESTVCSATRRPARRALDREVADDDRVERHVVLVDRHCTDPIDHVASPGHRSEDRVGGAEPGVSASVMKNWLPLLSRFVMGAQAPGGYLNAVRHGDRVRGVAQVRARHLDREPIARVAPAEAVEIAAGSCGSAGSPAWAMKPARMRWKLIPS